MLLTRPHQILDVAPEEQLQRRLRSRPEVDYISIDLDSPIAMYRMDVTELQYQDASFDVVFCNHVLEHVPADRLAMSELLRVLRPGGWAIFHTPFDASRSITDEDPSVVSSADRARRFGQADHVRLYGTDLFDRLRGVGWEIELVDILHEFGRPAIDRHRLDADEKIIIGRRRASDPRQEE